MTGITDSTIKSQQKAIGQASHSEEEKLWQHDLQSKQDMKTQSTPTHSGFRRNFNFVA